jgi:hypothetical protein
MRPPATTAVIAPIALPLAVTSAPELPFISAISIVRSEISVPMYGRPETATRNRDTLAAPVIGRSAAFAFPPPSVTRVTADGSGQEALRYLTLLFAVNIESRAACLYVLAGPVRELPHGDVGSAEGSADVGMAEAEYLTQHEYRALLRC